MLRLPLRPRGSFLPANFSIKPPRPTLRQLKLPDSLPPPPVKLPALPILPTLADEANSVLGGPAAAASFKASSKLPPPSLKSSLVLRDEATHWDILEPISLTGPSFFCKKTFILLPCCEDVAEPNEPPPAMAALLVSDSSWACCNSWVNLATSAALVDCNSIRACSVSVSLVLVSTN
eukprot:scaffold2590_cov160-Amphora_coffeaeformis.AAC.8